MKKTRKKRCAIWIILLFVVTIIICKIYIFFSFDLPKPIAKKWVAQLYPVIENSSLSIADDIVAHCEKKHSYTIEGIPAEEYEAISLQKMFPYADKFCKILRINNSTVEIELIKNKSTINILFYNNESSVIVINDAFWDISIQINLEKNAITRAIVYNAMRRGQGLS